MCECIMDNTHRPDFVADDFHTHLDKAQMSRCDTNLINVSLIAFQGMLSARKQNNSSSNKQHSLADQGLSVLRLI